MSSKFIKEQEQKQKYKDKHQKKLSNIEQMVSKTKHELEYVNNIMKIQNNKDKLKERQNAFVLNIGQGNQEDNETS